MKKLICFFLILCAVFAVSGCAKLKTLHCDRCNKEVTVSESSNMEESWTIYCDECNEALFGDDPILGDN